MEDIIIECLEFKEDDADQLTNIITEAISRLPFPAQLKSRVARRRLFEECGKKSFIDPANLQYPVFNPKTCDYDCALLNRAYYELSMSSKTGARDMKHKVKSIMENVGCSSRIMVRLQDDVNVELDYLMGLLS